MNRGYPGPRTWFLWTWWLLLATAPSAPAQSGPTVADDVDFGKLRVQTQRLLEALKGLKAPMPPETAKALRSALQEGNKDASAASARIQQLLDAHCLIVVTINPESRVKAARGPGQAVLRVNHETVVLVKVHNEAGVTHALMVSGPQLRSAGQTERDHWLEAIVHAKPPLAPKLSGQKVEYVILRLTAHEAGKREATLKFNVGQGTQDLGFRAEVPVLFTINN